MGSLILRDVFTTKIYIKNIEWIQNGNLRQHLTSYMPRFFNRANDENVIYKYFEPYGNNNHGTGTVNAPNGPPFNITEIRRMAMGTVQTISWIFEVDSGLERDEHGFIIDPDRHFHLTPFRGPRLDFNIFPNVPDPFLKCLRSVDYYSELCFIVIHEDKARPFPEMWDDVAEPVLFSFRPDDGVYQVRFGSVMEAIQAICVLHGNTSRTHQTMLFCNDDSLLTPWPVPNIIGKGLARDGGIARLKGAFFVLKNLRKDLFDTRYLYGITTPTCEICNVKLTTLDIHKNKQLIAAKCQCRTERGSTKATFLALKIEGDKPSFYKLVQQIDCNYNTIEDFQSDVMHIIRLERFTAKAIFMDKQGPVIPGVIVGVVGRVFSIQVHVSDLYKKNPQEFLQSFGRLWTLSIKNLQQITIEYIDLGIASAENVIDPDSLDIDGKKDIIDPNQYLHMIFVRPTDFFEDAHIKQRCTLTALWTDEFYDRFTKTIEYFSTPGTLSGCSHMSMLVMGNEEKDLKRNIKVSSNIKTYWNRIDLLGPSAKSVHKAFGKTQLAAVELSLCKRVLLFEEEELGNGLMMANIITLLLATGAKEKVVMVFPDVVYLEKALQYLHQLCGDQNADNLGIAKYLDDYNPFMHPLARGLGGDDLQRYELGRRVSDVTQRERWVKVLGKQIDIFDRMSESGSTYNLTPKEFHIITNATAKLSMRFLMHHCKIILTTPMNLSKIILDHDKNFLNNSGVNIVAYDVTRTSMTNSLAMMMGNPKRIIMFGSPHKDRQCVQDYGAECAGLRKSLYDFFNIRGLPFEVNSIRNYPLENGFVI